MTKEELFDKINYMFLNHYKDKINEALKEDISKYNDIAIIFRDNTIQILGCVTTEENGIKTTKYCNLNH